MSAIADAIDRAILAVDGVIVGRAPSQARFNDWLDFLVRQSLAERKMERDLKPVYQDTWRQVVKAAKDADSASSIVLPTVEELAPPFEEVGEEHFPMILRGGWNRAGQQIKKASKRSQHRAGCEPIEPSYFCECGFNAARRAISFAISIPGIADYIKNRPRTYARKVSRTVLDTVTEIIAAEVEAGSSVDQIALRLQEEADIQPESSANRTARTESVSAMNKGSLVHYQESGVVSMKDWLDSDDAKVRPTHIGVERVPLNERFRVGSALLDHPGDPSGPAEEIINCRCSVAPVVEDDE